MLKQYSSNQKMERSVNKVKRKKEFQEEVETKWNKLDSMRFQAIEGTQYIVDELLGKLAENQNKDEKLSDSDYQRLLYDFRMACLHHGANIDNAVKAGFHDPKDTQLNILQERDKMIENLAKLDKEISEDETEIILLEEKNDG